MATVEEARRTNQGPFRAIAPIFRIALDAQRGQLLNLEAAARSLQPIFGQHFNEYAIEAFMPQLEQLGWLAREQTRNNQAVYRVIATLPELNEDSATESSQEKIDRLHAAFREFRSISVPLFAVSMDKLEFDWRFFQWATSLDGSDKAALQAHVVALSGGTKPSVKGAFLDETQRFTKIDKSISIEFAGFIKWLSRNQRSELNDVAALTELGLALEFLEEIRQPSARQNSTVDTIFILDAPVMLDILGLSGESRKLNLTRCVNSLKSRGAKVVTMDHCLEELSEIIDTVLDRPATLRYGLTGDAIRANPPLANRARTVSRQPDHAARTVGVEVLHFDINATSPNPSYFPETLIDRFKNTATWHDFYKTDQRYRDALSIAYVMRRRAGRSSSDPLDTHFILVTRNSTFTRFSDSFVKSKLETPQFAFGPAIEIKTLAAFVWMRFGDQDGDDIPRNQLIAACDRILASNREILRKAEAKIKDYKGEEMAFALLNSQQAVLDLIVSTGGDPDVIDAANGEEIIRALTISAEERGRAEERKRADEEQAFYENIVSEREADIERRDEKIKSLAHQEFRNQSVIQDYERIASQRAEATGIQIACDSDQISWIFVVLIWVVLGSVTVLGQLFVWQGPKWWLLSVSHLAEGLCIIACSMLFAAAGVRLFRNGYDLPKKVQTALNQYLLKRKLQGIAISEDRDEVRVYLLAKGLLHSRKTQHIEN